MSTSSGGRLNELRSMIQSSRSEQAATANAISTDLKRVVTIVDSIEEEVGAGGSDSGKEIQQMKEDIAKMNAGDLTERTTRRRKAMENNVGEKMQRTMVYDPEWMGRLGQKKWKP